MANKFRFTNEKCPVCNNTFNPDDDIVVCPECGTPHHRDCYKENNGCANYHKHSENFRWEPDFIQIEEAETASKPTEEKSIYQQALEMSEMSFPTIQTERINPIFREKFGDLEDGISAEDAAIFVRQDSHRYISKFQKITNGKLTWNWAAFFFTPYWFFYRKLYKIGAVIFAIFLLITSISFLPAVTQLNTDIASFEKEIQEIANSDITEEESRTAMLEIADKMSLAIQKNRTGAMLVLSQSAASLVLSVFVGLNANKWYYKHIKKQLTSIKAESTSENYRNNLFIKGGTSFGAPLLVIILERAIFMVFEMLFSTFI